MSKRDKPGSEVSEHFAPTETVASRRIRSRSRWVMLLLVLVAFAVAGSYLITQVPTKVELGKSSTAKPTATPTVPADSDDDGLIDEVEAGWITLDGTEYRTDPSQADTDGDGLTDGDEAGAAVTNAPVVLAAGAQSESIYFGYSNPLLPDTDGDELGDADEADLSLDPWDRDTDSDGIEDGPEVETVGTAADVADTDGDGFEDGYEDVNRESQGLDPLWVDVEVGKWTYAGDYAKGAVAGDLWREDSLAWIAGNLTSGATSSIPVIGSIVGAVGDVRDAIGSAIHRDWVGSGFSVVGVIPGGDLVAIPGKAGKFVARNPHLAAAVAAAIVGLNQIPEKIKVEAAQAIWKNWDDLKRAGASDQALLQLQKGRTNLDDVADALKRPTHVMGATATFFPTGSAGEEFLEGLYGANVSGATKQVSASTTGCIEVCNAFRRRFDVVADGVAHESKVGYVRLTGSIEKQIRSDAWLIDNGDIEGAMWHFFPSSRSNTVGADTRLLDLLDELQIPYTMHLPA